MHPIRLSVSSIMGGWWLEGEITRTKPQSMWHARTSGVKVTRKGSRVGDWGQRRCGMRHKLLTQCALFVLESIFVLAKKGHTESAFRDACRTSSGLGKGGGGGAYSS